ncbi:putative dual-specificity RNA methyltransferase RlmN [Anaerocolumna cellulosilytica]|uniref:Probable dual-specificity RNA methyltransferase RlmN n=1 Tax=Anaerocolumna cellulosilytica TaxID=433286 RepID=A0A6S6QVK7_9FIRM|nr:23S rRNA (adenine(2503)-C(2))-methyltransferase RlmN [Anaerocolumna cellulosilytica]MBB5197070.1 23S rRNA (adenine2503-C2)-methyltransferase [Anaerocolumna cellulosilytica]BCJ95283.1 putative dual-specificity RNA methyltransferase RlmN [Anaerocolumna cellulosilytica]
MQEIISEKIDIKSLNIEDIKKVLETLGEKTFRANQIYEWLHVKLVSDFEEMTNLSKVLREQLKANCSIANLTVLNKLESNTGETSKFLFQLRDKNVLESVLMKYHHGNSVCISSQVGCKMGCKFCASTLNGFERNLTTGEMLDQIYKIQKISGERVSNVVVMGTGEPLDNLENLIKFIHIISDEKGLNISQRNITVSTCGLVDKIKELAEEELQITLALSLHAPNDTVRRELMPIALRYDLDTVLAACEYYYKKTGRRLTFEYSLVEGVNDLSEYAKELAGRLKGMNCHVNLIPVNPIKERNYRQSQAKNIQNFKNILEKYRINVTIRREMGTDIDAACGQLRKSYIDKTMDY